MKIMLAVLMAVTTAPAFAATFEGLGAGARPAAVPSVAGVPVPGTVGQDTAIREFIENDGFESSDAALEEGVNYAKAIEGWGERVYDVTARPGQRGWVQSVHFRRVVKAGHSPRESSVESALYPPDVARRAMESAVAGMRASGEQVVSATLHAHGTEASFEIVYVSAPRSPIARAADEPRGMILRAEASQLLRSSALVAMHAARARLVREGARVGEQGVVGTDGLVQLWGYYIRYSPASVPAPAARRPMPPDADGSGWIISEYRFADAAAANAGMNARMAALHADGLRTSGGGYAQDPATRRWRFFIQVLPDAE